MQSEKLLNFYVSGCGRKERKMGRKKKNKNKKSKKAKNKKHKRQESPFLVNRDNSLGSCCTHHQFEVMQVVHRYVSMTHRNTLLGRDVAQMR